MRKKPTVGGSEVAALMGYSPWCSPAKLYDRIMKRERSESSLAQLIGTHCEAGVVKVWCHQKYIKPSSVKRAKSRIKDGWMRGTPDRIVWGNEAPIEGLEIKFTDNHDGGFGRTGSNAWPLYYKTQCAWYRNIFELPRWRLVALIYGTPNRTVGLRLAEYVYERDDKFEAELIAKARKFYDENLLAGVRPPEAKVEVPVLNGSAPDWMKQDSQRTSE